MRIRQIGDPVLHTPTPLVNFDENIDLKFLISIMTRELRTSGGIGIACNQCSDIVDPYSITITGTNDQVRARGRYPDVTIPHEAVMVNLKILEYSEKTYYPEQGEGCLSVYGSIRARVKRHHSVRIEYYDLGGNKHLETHSGLVAFIIQHEYDHLMGITFFDKILSELNKTQCHRVKSIAESILASQDKSHQQAVSIQPIGLSFDRDETGTLLMDEALFHTALQKSELAVCRGIYEVSHTTLTRAAATS